MAAANDAPAYAASSVSARLDALTGRVNGLVVTIQEIVTEKFNMWSDVFFKDSREASKLIAEKVDYISDAMLGGCSDDPTDDVSNVRLPEEHADLLDHLRQFMPETYRALRDGAQTLNKSPPLKVRDVLASVLETVEATA